MTDINNICCIGLMLFCLSGLPIDYNANDIESLAIEKHNKIIAKKYKLSEGTEDIIKVYNVDNDILYAYKKDDINKILFVYFNIDENIIKGDLLIDKINSNYRVNISKVYNSSSLAICVRYWNGGTTAIYYDYYIYLVDIDKMKIKCKKLGLEGIYFEESSEENYIIKGKGADEPAFLYRYQIFYDKSANKYIFTTIRYGYNLSRAYNIKRYQASNWEKEHESQTIFCSGDIEKGNNHTEKLIKILDTGIYSQYPKKKYKYELYKDAMKILH